MDRIINIKIAGTHLSKDNNTAGTKGEGNITNLLITFDEGWKGFAKTITFWNALGLNPVEGILTIIENISEDPETYIVPIPAEAMEEAGMMTFVIDGYSEENVEEKTVGKRQRSIAGELEVEDSPIVASHPVDPTPTKAEELQLEIEFLSENVYRKDETYSKEEADAAVQEYVALYDGHVQEMIVGSANDLRGEIGVVASQMQSLNEQIDDRYTKEESDAAVREYVALYDGHVQEMIVGSANDLRGEIGVVASQMQSLNEDVYRKNETYSKEEVDELLNPPKVYKTFGVAIDLSNSNPETSVTYTDDAVGMTAGSSDWDETEIFKNIKPCLFKGGAVVGYLNKNNFAQFEDGTEATITPDADGDVMIEIPKMGYKIAKSGNILTVQVTNVEDAEDFSYLAHTRETEGDRDKLYVGAFLGGIIDGKLRSTINNPALAETRDAVFSFRTSAQTNGAGYDAMSFYPLTLIQCLFLLKYKNLNSQAALGKGLVSESTCYTVGNTVSAGMDYGSTSSGMEQMKFLGIEDLWGNLWQFIDGIKMKDTHVEPGPGYVSTFYAATNNFGDDACYTSISSQIALGYSSGYVRNVQGSNTGGFLQYSASASTSTYFCDRTYVFGPEPDSFPMRIGGMYDSGDNAGIFSHIVDYVQYSSDGSHTGARLMYL